MKVSNQKFAIFLLIIAVIVCVLGWRGRRKAPLQNSNIYDVWYINLDRSKDRNENFLKQAEKLRPFVPTRFAAVDGKVLTIDDYNRLKVPSWARPEFAREDRQSVRKGEIGCYLSHRNLLEKLSTINAPGHMGHLIFEDDIHIEDDFLKKWHSIAAYLDPNWDIVTFGIPGPGSTSQILNVRKNIGKPSGMDNNFGYLVKHESLPKILAATKVMSEPFDNILERNMDTLNIYSVSPPLVKMRLNNDTTMSG
jgi:hypothetical protein